MNPIRRLCSLGLLCGIAACTSGEDGNTIPPGPSGTNHIPAITAITVSPGFGVSSVTSFSFAATAADADNDTLTYSWDFGGGTSRTGPNVTATLVSESDVTVRLTVSDGHGGTATGSRLVPVGTMSGTWNFQNTANCSGVFNTGGTTRFTFVQSGNVITSGSFTSPSDACGIAAGVTGTLDTFTPTTINASGLLTPMIFQIPGRPDLTLQATMTGDPRTVTGILLFGANNNSFRLTKN